MMFEIKNEEVINLLYDLKDGLLPKKIHDVIIAIGSEILKYKISEYNYFIEHMKSNVLFDDEVPVHKKKVIPSFDDSDRLITHNRKARHLDYTYKQSRYKTLDKDQIRFRFKNGRLQPAVISNNVANEFYHNNYRHIKLLTDENNKLYMTFGLDKPDTVAPARNPEISRLTSFGRNKATNEITTFAFNGDLFQKTILNYAGYNTDELKDGDVIILDFKRHGSQNGRKILEILKNDKFN